MFKTEGMLNLTFLPQGDYRVQNRTPFVAQFQEASPQNLDQIIPSNIYQMVHCRIYFAHPRAAVRPTPKVYYTFFSRFFFRV